MPISQIVTLTKDILLSLAAITTACVAVFGLSAWKRELKGKAEFEVARGLIRSTYKLRDAITSCRSPFVRGQEYPEGYLTLGREATPEEHERAWAHVFQKRWEPVSSAIQDFDTFTLEAEALWGMQIRIKTEKFLECISELLSSIETMITDYRSGGEVFKVDAQFGIRTRATAFSTGTGENEFSKKIVDAITDIETEIRPHLKRG